MNELNRNMLIFYTGQQRKNNKSIVKEFMMHGVMFNYIVIRI